MKFVKLILMGAGSLALAGLILALLAPRAAHAAAATLVLITNTAENPVHSQVINSGATPVVTQSTSTQASQIVTLQCVLTLACEQISPIGYLSSLACTVPNGQALIVTSVDILPGHTADSLGAVCPGNLQNSDSCYEIFSSNPGGYTTSFPLGSGIVIAAGSSPLFTQVNGTVPAGYFYIHGCLSTVPLQSNNQ